MGGGWGLGTLYGVQGCSSLDDIVGVDHRNDVGDGDIDIGGGRRGWWTRRERT